MELERGTVVLLSEVTHAFWFSLFNQMDFYHMFVFTLDVRLPNN